MPIPWRLRLRYPGTWWRLWWHRRRSPLGQRWVDLGYVTEDDLDQDDPREVS